MVYNSNQNINDHQLYRVNQTRVKLKELNTGNQNPKVDSRKFSQMRGIGIEWAKKIIMVTAQNSSRDVMTPITKRFWMRQAMFRRQCFRGMEYTNTMIAGVKYASGKKVAHVYVTDFSEFIIYPPEHRREAHTFLY